eukprot:TRINITY_DN4366_c0_g1_i1.p1 TRINITY_DN4366_c0_g1~~TRINITY_DN4366_c0_g1_i1.p1  ORF type:complete len:235 (-),score=73.03 TRINITY_DN4366_c0_g1_i1:136-840(-)
MKCDCRLVLAMGCGALLGTVLGELTANCLIEIYHSLVFSLVFAVCFMMISGVMIWRVSKTSASRTKKAVVASLTASVFLSAVACLAIRFINDANSDNHAQQLHLILFSQIAVSLSLVFTFTLLEFITLGIFEKIGCGCCPHGYLPSSKQLLVLLFGSIFAGIMFGLLFGVLKVQLVDSALTVLQLYMLIALPAGCVLGCVLALLYRVVGGDTVLVTLDRERAPLLPEERILWQS